MAFEIAKRRTGYIYPYTCPFFEPSEKDIIDCVHMNEWEAWNDSKLISKVGCSYGRRICYIQVDPYILQHCENANDLINVLPTDLSSGELETIKSNVIDYYKKFKGETAYDRFN